MKWQYATLTDQQIRNTYFVVPEIGNIYSLALSGEGYQSFIAERQIIRAMGGDLLLIGWPDGKTITYQSRARPAAIDLDTLVETYSASAAMHRVTTQKY